MTATLRVLSPCPGHRLRSQSVNSYQSNSRPYDDALRLSDQDRSDAIAALGHAMGEGRIDMGEFDERCQAVADARTRSDLTPLFADIPGPDAPHTAHGGALEKHYSTSEIEAARASGRKQRLGTALLVSLAGIVGAPISFIAGLDAVGSGTTIAGLAGSAVLTFLIPAIWILLYVMKVGPESWNTPSPQQLERQRLREIEASQARERAERRALESRQWAERRQQASDLTGDALKFARRKLDGWSGHNS